MAGPRPDRYRLSDEERDEALAQLRTALEEGRLDPEEHGDRTGAVLAAVTNEDLLPVFEDLPASSRPSALAVPGDAERGDEHPRVPVGKAAEPPASGRGHKDPDRRNRPHAGGLVIWGGIIFVIWGVPSISSGNTSAILAWLVFLVVFLVPGVVVTAVQTIRDRSDRDRPAID